MMKGFFRLPGHLPGSDLWLHDMRKQVSGLGSVDWLSGWVKDFISVEIRLLPGTLWGHNLERVTNYVASAPDEQTTQSDSVRARPTSPDARPRPGQRQSAPRDPILKNRRGQMPPHHLAALRNVASPTRLTRHVNWVPDPADGSATQSRQPNLAPDLAGESFAGHQAVSPFMMSHQASRTLLHNLASAAGQQATSPSNSDHALPDRIGQSAQGVASPRSPSSRRVPTVMTGSEQMRYWQDKVSARAGRRLLADWLAEEGETAALSMMAAAFWSQPVSGEMAPESLLRALVAPSSGQPEQAASVSQRHQAEGNGHRSVRSAAQVRLPANGNSQGVNVSHQRPNLHHMDTPPAPDAEFIRPVSPDVMPPRLAHVMPPLMTPQQPGQPMLPVVSALMQQVRAEDNTRSEADDLNDLALKMKRILDEEARRFGIDV